MADNDLDKDRCSTPSQDPSAPSVERLIERLEAASEGSIELDAAVAESLGHQPDIDLDTCRAGDREFDLVRYTTSLDAALTLVPEGWGWSLDYYDPGEPDGASVAFRECSGFRMGEPPRPPAIALCIAALKARRDIPLPASSPKGDREPGTASNTDTVFRPPESGAP